jgi:hypothetical protein
MDSTDWKTEGLFNREIGEIRERKILLRIKRASIEQIDGVEEVVRERAGAQGGRDFG